MKTTKDRRNDAVGIELRGSKRDNGLSEPAARLNERTLGRHAARTGGEMVVMNGRPPGWARQKGSVATTASGGELDSERGEGRRWEKGRRKERGEEEKKRRNLQGEKGFSQAG